MNRIYFWSAALLCSLFLLNACQSESSDHTMTVLVPTATRAANEGTAEEEQILLDALEAIDPTLENESYFLNDLYDDGKKSSNLGNGKYINYLKMTFSLTSKPLYQKEIMEARQVCIREMMHTHYSHTKEEVIEELSRILAAEILVRSEKVQITHYLNTVISGVYQDMPIQFNCNNPENCNFM